MEDNLLKKHGFFFKKQFGQNFLSDTNLLRAIAFDAGVDKSVSVLEIGAQFLCDITSDTQRDADLLCDFAAFSDLILTDNIHYREPAVKPAVFTFSCEIQHLSESVGNERLTDSVIFRFLGRVQGNIDSVDFVF